MPVLLSLPIPQIPTGIGEYLPIRIPFPFWRIASILPHAVNGPIKSSLIALFKLAWSAKLQIPVLITVVFMACDIRLQLEINIFWETNNRHVIPVHGTNQRNDANADRRRAIMEDQALVNRIVSRELRQRLIQGIRANRMRAHTLRNRADQLRITEESQFPGNAPLATEEDSDLDDSRADYDEDESDEETITCSQRSTTSEAGSFESDEEDTEDAEGNEDEPLRKKRKIKPPRPIPQDEDDESTTTDEEDDNEDEDDDGDDSDNGGGMNGGSSHGFGGNGGSGYRDDPYDDDMADGDDDSQNDLGSSYSSPLVVEVEIRHRPLFGSSPADDLISCQNHRSSLKLAFRPFHYFKFDECSSLIKTISLLVHDNQQINHTERKLRLISNEHLARFFPTLFSSRMIL